MIANSSKPNKLRNVYTIRSTVRNVTIQKLKIYYIKIKVIAFIINSAWLIKPVNLTSMHMFVFVSQVVFVLQMLGIVHGIHQENMSVTYIYSKTGV